MRFSLVTVVPAACRRVGGGRAPASIMGRAACQHRHGKRAPGAARRRSGRGRHAPRTFFRRPNALSCPKAKPDVPNEESRHETTWSRPCCWSLSWPRRPRPARSRFSAAASLTNANRGPARPFERSHPGLLLAPTFAASGTLLGRMANGKPSRRLHQRRPTASWTRPPTGGASIRKRGASWPDKHPGPGTCRPGQPGGRFRARFPVARRRAAHRRRQPRIRAGRALTPSGPCRTRPCGSR